MAGIIGIKPEIEKASLEGRKLFVQLKDKREITIPKQYLPFLKGKPGKIFISDYDTLIFENADEVIHISEILGRFEDYKYSG